MGAVIEVLLNKVYTFSAQYTGACPNNCTSGQICSASDSGCPECERAYYGRQCQHRKYITLSL